MYNPRPILPKKFNRQAKHTQPQMRWKNLGDGNCPNPVCEKSLFYNEDTAIFSCSCGYRISYEKYSKITSDLAQRTDGPIRQRRGDRATPEEERQSQLNDL